VNGPSDGSFVGRIDSPFTGGRANRPDPA